MKSKLTLKQHKDKIDKYYMLFLSITTVFIYLLTSAVLFFTLSIDEVSIIKLIDIITVVSILYIDYLI
jgi:hypothetical protein